MLVIQNRDRHFFFILGDAPVLSVDGGAGFDTKLLKISSLDELGPFVLDAGSSVGENIRIMKTIKRHLTP